MTTTPDLEVSEQVRINYGAGLTPTERRLKELGEKSFLRFWSHANPHVTVTQELCDLLVVCGDYVFIISDKAANYQYHKESREAWPRWYRSAVAESVNQIRGAYRNLYVLNSTIYKDNTCNVPLGLPIPPRDRAKIYRIASVSVTKDDDDESLRRPFLTIDGGLSGEQHCDPSSPPFCIGDVAASQPFVHVIDFAGLQEVLKSFDTVTDFARYLDARETFIRAEGRNHAANELCIVTRFLLSFTPSGYPVALDSANPGFTWLGNGERLAESTERALADRKEANAGSYLWDDLIERLARNVEQQSFAFSTYRTVSEAERVVRVMALEPRLKRRVLAKCWQSACLEAEPGRGVNLRTMLHDKDSLVTYIFMTMLRTDDMSDEEYHNHRRSLLLKLALAPIHEDPTTQIVIGLASELGQAPDTLDRVYFNVLEDEKQDTLAQDARESSQFKRAHFEDPVPGQIIEREIP